jgi:hypothetical protein
MIQNEMNNLKNRNQFLLKEKEGLINQNKALSSQLKKSKKKIRFN